MQKYGLGDPVLPGLVVNMAANNVVVTVDTAFSTLIATFCKTNGNVNPTRLRSLGKLNG